MPRPVILRSGACGISTGFYGGQAEAPDHGDHARRLARLPAFATLGHPLASNTDIENPCATRVYAC